ncbi:rhomboid family intramembrane serine protease [Pelotalea chapellei]|uniref:Rhomboid family intramembrane serine protease n=1 Tax=Pelotalea chapellei TaxID=44671 RepID=A0ABS5UCC8_9BACT|nr:rhomboid family intramembrane serine protease [Pelotalea chapellei]MBT1073340.1 rhomboid family intramembrane serine protease [Pelotalea chapellei]
MKNKAILCPRCHQLVGSDEATCSWCGTSRTSPWWHMVSLAQGMSGENGVFKAIITLNILLYVFSLLISSRIGGSAGGLFGVLAPDRTSLLLLGATGTVPIDQYGRLWTLFSASYLHAGVLHITFNLMALRNLAPLTTEEYGVSRMFIIYTLGGAGGFWASYMAGVPFTVGASAAVCSLIGALLYFGRSRGGAYGSAVYSEVKGWIISLLIFGLIMPGINNWGHGGGVISGIILGKLLGYGEHSLASKLHVLLATICAIGTIGVLLWAGYSALIYEHVQK